MHCLARVFPEFKFVWLAEETEKNLPVELDFMNEGKNIEKVAKIFERYKFVKVPKVYWKYCSDRVLTMEYCEGSRVDDLEGMKKNGINVNKITERMGIIFSEMIFSHGFVHCDPHPGNVLIRAVKSKSKKKDFQIVLLDHGLYQSLSASFRYNYAKIWMSILEQDIKKLETLTQNFNVGEYFGLFACIITGRSWESINQGIDRTNYTHNEGLEIKSEAGKYIREISIVLNRIPREMLLLLKTNDLLRGIEMSLHTRNSSSSFIHMSKCCVKLINSYEREMANGKFENDKRNRSVAVNDFKKLKFNFVSYLKENFDLFKIFSYQLFLYVFNF